MQQYFYTLFLFFVFLVSLTGCKTISGAHGPGLMAPGESIPQPMELTDFSGNPAGSPPAPSNEEVSPSLIGTISNLPYQFFSCLKIGYQYITCFYFPSLCRFTARNGNYLFILLYLLILWAVFRAYDRSRTQRTGPQKQRLDYADLAIIKVIKDNAAWVWDRNRPDRKVIRLDDYRFQ